MENNKIGTRLRKLRYNMDLTQEKLGEKADLHYSYIGQVERGDKTPSLKALMKIADALNISLEELIREENINSQQLTNIKLKNINKLLEDRDPEELDLIYVIIENVINLIDKDFAEKEYHSEMPDSDGTNN